MMKWFVYALFNKQTKRIYIGQTDNLERRLAEHNLKRGNHYTAQFSEAWRLIYKEECESRRNAIIRERQLKSYKSREFIKNLIHSPVAQW